MPVTNLKLSSKKTPAGIDIGLWYPKPDPAIEISKCAPSYISSG